MSPSAVPLRAIAAPASIATAVAIVYLAWAPASTDLAAQTFRADLFSDHGLVLWNNGWYLGHHTLGYSLLFPPLAAALGVRVVGALAAIAAAVLFALLVGRRFGERARIGVLWFSLGVSAWLFTGRMTFILGVAIGLAASVAADRGAIVWTAAMAALCALASPVAGFFLGIAGFALALAGDRRTGVALALPAGVAILALAIPFPVGGEQPYPGSTYFPIPIATVLALLLVPPEHRTLRIGILVYGVVATLLLVVPTPIGTNAARLGALLAGPLAALVLVGRPRLLALLAAPLLFWQLLSPVEDVVKAEGDPSTERSYYEPLFAELDRVTAGRPPVRIHIPPTNNRWEATYVAPRYPLARGWLRQLESEDFDLFIDDGLDPGSYREWLDEHAVSHVAVADVEPDYLAREEVELIDGGLGYLDPLWESDDWRLYRVEDATSLATGGAEVSALGPDWFELEAPRAGRYEVAIEHTRYWSVAAGDACVEEGEDERTAVEAARPGTIRVETRLFADSCSE